MTLAEWTLLLKYILEGFTYVKGYLANKDVRDTFSELKAATTDDEKKLVAQKLAGLIYGKSG